MKYDVFFIKSFDYYGIEAESREEALEIAEKEFYADQHSSIADPTYDEVEVLEQEEEET